MNLSDYITIWGCTMLSFVVCIVCVFLSLIHWGSLFLLCWVSVWRKQEEGNCQSHSSSETQEEISPAEISVSTWLKLICNDFQFSVRCIIKKHTGLEKSKSKESIFTFLRCSQSCCPVRPNQSLAGPEKFLWNGPPFSHVELDRKSFVSPLMRKLGNIHRGKRKKETVLPRLSNGFIGLSFLSTIPWKMEGIKVSKRGATDLASRHFNIQILFC